MFDAVVSGGVGFLVVCDVVLLSLFVFDSLETPSYHVAIPAWLELSILLPQLPNTLLKFSWYDFLLSPSLP